MKFIYIYFFLNELDRIDLSINLSMSNMIKIDENLVILNLNKIIVHNLI
jgi:hypothetical protein